jgi:hypothetical protein
VLADPCQHEGPWTSPVWSRTPEEMRTLKVVHQAVL